MATKPTSGAGAALDRIAPPRQPTEIVLDVTPGLPLHIPGHSGYTFAEHMTARGFV
jgi:hypothetical protein